MNLTRERVKKIFAEEVDKMFEGKVALQVRKGSLGVTLIVEENEIVSKHREKEIENVHKSG